MGNLYFLSSNGVYPILLLDTGQITSTKFHLTREKSEEFFVLVVAFNYNSDAVPFGKRRSNELVIGLS